MWGFPKMAFSPKLHGSAVICGEVYCRILTQVLEMVSACVSHGSVVEGPSNAANEVSVPWREDYKCVVKQWTLRYSARSLWLCALADGPTTLCSLPALPLVPEDESTCHSFPNQWDRLAVSKAGERYWRECSPGRSNKLGAAFFWISGSKFPTKAMLIF